MRFLLAAASMAFALFNVKAQMGPFTIPDEYTHDFVFVMQGDQAIGSGFLISVPEGAIHFAYFVTAKHVMMPAVPMGSEVLHLRVNNRGIDTANIVDIPLLPIDGSIWLAHPNPAIDVAVCLLVNPDSLVSKYDLSMIGVSGTDTDAVASAHFISKYNVKPGDPVFNEGLIPGLFSATAPNRVLFRFGYLSMLGDKGMILPSDIYGVIKPAAQRAHFLDCPAFPGQSGGPAFVNVQRIENGTVVWRIAVLGVETEFVQSDLRIAAVPTDPTKYELLENTGLSKVVPIDYVLDILFSPSQIAFRKSMAQAEHPAIFATPTPAPTPSRH